MGMQMEMEMGMEMEMEMEMEIEMETEMEMEHGEGGDGGWRWRMEMGMQMEMEMGMQMGMGMGMGMAHLTPGGFGYMLPGRPPPGWMPTAGYHGQRPSPNPAGPHHALPAASNFASRSTGAATGAATGAVAGAAPPLLHRRHGHDEQTKPEGDGGFVCETCGKFWVSTEVGHVPFTAHTQARTRGSASV